MKYLSYQKQEDGQVVAVSSDVIDKHSTFQPDGNLYSLEGIALGYNVVIFGTLAPHGLINFDKRLVTPDWQAPHFSDFGRLVPQSDGTVAIEWPL